MRNLWSTISRRIQYPDASGALTNSPDAKHRGDFGLQIALPKVASLPQNPTDEERKIGPFSPGKIDDSVSNAELPGRPTKIGVWIKVSGGTSSISMKVHDPGIDARQQRWPDNVG